MPGKTLSWHIANAKYKIAIVTVVVAHIITISHSHCKIGYTPSHSVQ